MSLPWQERRDKARREEGEANPGVVSTVTARQERLGRRREVAHL